ncbi:sensor histidine kinase [Frigoriflavimonas asaccharolytica]|uniref:histidine kinase n=1 Tax=Frigoriflavimonas asaccharolytica TaxID=2735899 RepID=A0A8J8K7G3_9FLAO|nr:HAMP domain-containing sensor histidine kinase [Frigoriflavimonas asaccharolytica]NRS91456.1 signal transduction histidine kinase [Frigoriflavimonas asaccharolytica]
MFTKTFLPEKLNFKWRKTVHYSLILCIILIQIAIAGFVYNEYNNRNKIQFFEKQLTDINTVENLTEASKEDFFKAQYYLQAYTKSKKAEDLENYFFYIKKLDKNLESIKDFKAENVYLKKNLLSVKKIVSEKKNLKDLIDSTFQFTTKSVVKTSNPLPELKKIKVNYKLEIPDIEVKTIKDTTAKKGLFGRLGDAISGKEDRKRDSIVVTMREAKISAANEKLNNEVDSIINIVNNYYVVEIKKRKEENSKSKNNDTEDLIESKDKYFDVFTMYRDLLANGNNLMNIYEIAVKKSKKDLLNEIASQNSKTNKIRNYLVAGLLGLMFLVSILIMYFTRIAFIYENKLSAANEQITENLKFKNRILGMLSHELRSPLKIIGIFIKRINSRTEDIEVKSYLKSIKFTNNTLLMQANQILAYTKNQHIENKLNLTTFNLKEEFKSIIEAIEPYLETRNNKFIVNENIDSEIQVYTDSTKINQIFINILGNANKFTENGKITVTTNIERKNSQTLIMKTTISDTGVGISSSDLKEIFQPYYQGIISDEVENLGAGLGLSLCKEIVELFDGTISVDSEHGKGTNVTFDLILKISND